MAGIPAATMRKLVDLAKDAGLATADVGKFKRVAGVLWTRFEDHAIPAFVPDRDKVLVAAYKKEGKKHRKFGDLVVENLDKFDEDGNHKATNRCADDCGSDATKEALDEGTFQIDVEIFERAWDHTERRLGKLLKRARRIARKQGKELRDDAKGNGC